MQDFSKNSLEYIPQNDAGAKPDQKKDALEAALYVVATPIGNMRDITLRALDILKAADYVVCEDTRVTAKLLKRHQVEHKEFIIYNDHGGQKIREKILNLLIQGKVLAFVSDAGTPLISDPGFKLVRYIKEYGQKAIPVPGASSVISALCASGLACDNFSFLGFLPHSKIQKVNLLKSLPKGFTSIFFESANRMMGTLESICEIMSERNITVAKEITKIHEEIITKTAKEMKAYFENNPQKLRGEFVVIIEKAGKDEKKLDENELIAEIKEAIEAGFSIKELSKNLAEIYDLNKKDIYQLALKIQK